MEFLLGFLVIIFAAWFIGAFDGDIGLPMKDETGKGNDWPTLVGLIVFIIACIYFIFF